MKANSHPLPDLDILPHKYRWQLVTRWQLALVLALLGGVVLGYTLNQARTAGQQQVTAVQGDMRRLQIANAELAPQVMQVDQIRQEIAALKGELDKINKATAQLQSQRVDWAGLWHPILVVPPPGIELTSVIKDQKGITIEGLFPGGYPALTQYYQQLTAVPGAAAVTVTQTKTVEVPKRGELLSFGISVKLQGR